MLLTNFNAIFCGQYSAGPKSMDGGNSYYSAIYASQFSNADTNCHYGGTGNNACNCVIGAGNTPPTKDDYDLADSSIMASDKMASLSHTGSYTKNGGSTSTTQWQNRSNETIIIKEVGLAFKVTGSAYSKGGNVLVARKVLSTPVTVQPGETYAFTYNIKV